MSSDYGYSDRIYNGEGGGLSLSTFGENVIPYDQFDYDDKRAHTPLEYEDYYTSAEA